MSDTQTAQVADLVDRNAVDPEGDKIGTVHDVYVNDETGQPEWLAIKTGMFGSKLSFVPIAGPTWSTTMSSSPIPRTR
ncbi:MAG: PRC-barrel domain-containing protein [Ilumatobacteraceae bacterium]